jgi:hypothetical protein
VKVSSAMGESVDMQVFVEINCQRYGAIIQLQAFKTLLFETLTIGRVS